MALTVEDIKPSVNPDCGCYEEECFIYPFDVILHLEPDGTGDAFFDDGDGDIEKNFPAKNIEELRAAACQFVAELFSLTDPAAS